MSRSVAGNARRAFRRNIPILASLLALALIVSLVLFATLPSESRFDGLWLRSSGEPWMPEQIELRVRGSVMNEALPSASDYVTFYLVADGREHPWIDPEDGTTEKTYTARLTEDSFTLAVRTPDTSSGSTVATERWSLVNGSNELAIVNKDGQTLYRRASWLHRMLTHAP